MPTTELARPPGRRSIQIYGRPPSGDASGRASGSVGVVSGIFSLKSDDATAPPGYGTSATLGASTGTAIGPQSSPLPTANADVSVKRSPAGEVAEAAAGPGAAAGVTAAAVAQAATTTIRGLRGRLNEGTVHRALFPAPPSSMAVASGRTTLHTAPDPLSSTARPTQSRHGVGTGNGKVLVRLPSNVRGIAAAARAAPASRADASMGVAELVQEAGLSRTWAANFSSPGTLRETVSTSADAYSVFEEELVQELNEMRRAPAAYAAVVEREATMGAPYVLETDLYFADEAAAESAAIDLRRRVEEQYTGVSAEAASTGVSANGNNNNNGGGGGAAGAGAVTRGATRVLAPRGAGAAAAAGAGAASGASAGGNSGAAERERRRTKKGGGGGGGSSPRSPGLSPGAAASTGGHPRRRSSRPTSASAQGSATAPRREITPTDHPGGSVCGSGSATVAQVSVAVPGEQTLQAQGLRELTLAQLRNQFRCQQRYRAALETALRDLRQAHKQAEAAQLATWAAEDEKAMRKGRRSMLPNFVGGNVSTSSGAAHSNNTSVSSMVNGGVAGVPGAPGMGGAGGSASPAAAAAAAQHLKKLSHVSAGPAPRSSGASEDAVALRRSEEAVLLRSTHVARVQHVEQELREARDACRRSMIAANLVLDVVRALREARPAPPVQRHRGLSLAARDTADIYYGDEERVSALQDLFAASRNSLVGLAEPLTASGNGGTASAAAAAAAAAANVIPSTLERLSRRLEQRFHDEARAQESANVAAMAAASGHTPPGWTGRFGDGEESELHDVSRAEPVPSWVVPLLGEEASLLAAVAQDACSMYGYVSGEVRGLHLQASAGSPRALLLQMIMGLLTPVLDLSNHSLPGGRRPAAARGTLAAPTTGQGASATQRYAGVRVEGRVYAATDASAVPTGDVTPAGVGLSLLGSAAAVSTEGQPNTTLPPYDQPHRRSPAPLLEFDEMDPAPAVWLATGDVPFNATHRRGSGGGRRGATSTDTSHAQRAAAAAAQRLWPLLWAGAYSVGCGWQQLCGRRHVPTFAQACEEQQSQTGALCSPSRGDGTALMGGGGGDGGGGADGRGAPLPLLADASSGPVVCTTLLFASGFEEYEVVRGCSDMSPAAARRVVQRTSAAVHDGDATVGPGNNSARSAPASLVATLTGAAATAAAAAVGGGGGGGTADRIADVVEARRAAVDVHSTMGVTLLTPTMHPIQVPAGDPASRVVCVAVRVPHFAVESASTAQSPAAAAAATAGDDAAVRAKQQRSDSGGNATGRRHEPAIHVAAQVTRQSELTPAHPTTCAAEVLAQRSPVDPSVWLVFVDTTAAFQRHSEAAAAAAAASTAATSVSTNDTSGVLTRPVTFPGATPRTSALSAVSTSMSTPTPASAVPIALHIYAKDMSEPTAEYEHVAFIRLQQAPAAHGSGTRGGAGHGNVLSAAGTNAALPALPSTTATGAAILMAAEWQFLLAGLSCATTAWPVALVSGLPTTTGAPLALGGGGGGTAPAAAAAAPAAVSAGWPTLHEPLLGRDGVLLAPLTASLRDAAPTVSADAAATARLFRAASSLPPDGGVTGFAASASAALSSMSSAAAGRVIRVAVQLPVNANERWCRRRLSTLRRLQAKLEAEIAAEGDDISAAARAKGDRAVIPAALAGVVSPEPSLSMTDVDAPSAVAAGVLADAKAPLSRSLSTAMPAALSATVVGAGGGSAVTTTPLCASFVDGDTSVTTAGAGTAASPVRTKGKGANASNSDKKKPAAAAEGKRGAKKPAAAGDGASAASPSASSLSAGAAGTATGSPVSGGAAAAGAAPGNGAGSRRRTLSVYTTPRLPESEALREYEDITRRAAGAPGAGVVQRMGSLPAALQPTMISIVDLRALAARLHADVQVWQAHLTRVRPILTNERERLASEIVKKKGKEQLRLQHDHDDVANELSSVEKGVVALKASAAAATDALRLRERTQVLRRARAVRIADELASIAASASPPPAGAVSVAGPHANPTASHPQPPQPRQRQAATPFQASAPLPRPPHVTLRLFNEVAIPAGSGRNAAAFAAAHPQHAPSSQRAGVLDYTMREGDAALRLADRAVDEVVLLPQSTAPQTTASMGTTYASLTSHAVAAGGGGGGAPTAAEVYEVTCTVPINFTGRAALYIDDEVAVTWSV